MNRAEALRVEITRLEAQDMDGVDAGYYQRLLDELELLEAEEAVKRPLRTSDTVAYLVVGAVLVTVYVLLSALGG